MTPRANWVEQTMIASIAKQLHDLPVEEITIVRVCKRCIPGTETPREFCSCCGGPLIERAYTAAPAAVGRLKRLLRRLTHPFS